jgi:Outer membrane protein beta-barrel domain
MTSRDSSSGDLVQQSPAVIKDTAGKMVQLSLPAKQMEQAEPSRYVENDQEGGRVRVADIKDVLPAGSSRVDMPLQPIGSRAQIKTVAPAQRVLAVQPAMPKKASSLVALQRLRQWSVTAYYASELAGYSLTDQDSTAANGKEIDKKEKHVLSSSAVVLVNYQFSKHWGIETGLGYSWAKSHASPTTSYAVNNNGEIKFQVNTLSGYGYVPASSSSPAQVGDSVAVEHTTTTLHYLNAPFMLSYVLHFKKLTLMPGMGFSLNLLTGATLETRLRSASYVQQEYTVKMYGLKRLNYGMLLKTELAYAIDPHWSIDMVASFKNALTPINLHTVVATYPYNLGVGAGIKYSF